MTNQSRQLDAQKLKKFNFLALFNRWTTILLAVAAVFQMVFFPSVANFFAVVTCMFGWWVTVRSILLRSIVERYPLSTLTVMSYSLRQFHFPMMFTLLDAHPVIYNLNTPYEVFTHSLIGIFVLSLAHLTYRFLLERYTYFFNRIQRAMVWARLFDSPSNQQVWLIGMGGLMAMFYVYFYSPSVGNEVSGAGNKFIQGLIPFTYAPFYILLNHLHGSDRKVTKKNVIHLTLFTIALFLVSLGRNSRGAFMFGFTALGFGYFMGLLMGVYIPKFFTRRNIMIGFVVLWLLTGPLADIATAMVVVRKYRHDIDRLELLKLTYETFLDKEQLEEYENMSAAPKPVGGWDEHYLDNIFLSRFCNMKMNDASLEIADKLGGIDPVVTQYAIERPMAVFPDPIMKALHININKEVVNSYSSGDFLYDRVGGANALGGFRVGHFAGFGMASFGWWYLLLLYIVIIPAFFLWDTFVIRTRNSQFKSIFSFIALISLTTIFLYISFENVLYVVVFVIRGWIQMVLLYLFFFHASRLITRILKNS
ncbi:hypothetical protein [Filimonas lacunae]|nr:hypothetical protein [Filimonas lacunae]